MSKTIELNTQAVVGIIETMVYWHRKATFKGWTPTADNINALPDPLREYVCHIETLCDPAGIVAENTLLGDQTLQLDAMIARLKRVINEACDTYIDHSGKDEGWDVARKMYDIIGAEATDD